MNAIAFATKRTFHGFLRITRKPLASVGLTGARFDMMSALMQAFGGPPVAIEMRQSHLRRKLGVSASVVTRMLQALERLGWVKRWREKDGDGRQRRVTLTAEGLRRIRKAQRLILRGLLRVVFHAICFGQHRDPWQRIVHMDTLEGYLRVLRRHFGDRATLYYGWGHPDD